MLMLRCALPLLVLAACGSRAGSEKPTPTGVAAGSPPASGVAVKTRAPPEFPTKSSEFDGWRGVTIKRGVRCEGCCDLVYPRNFGLNNPEELRLLVKIVGAVEIEHDLDDCMMPRAEDTLDHLLGLAVERQDQGAARAILEANTAGGMEVSGGEVGEIFAARYVIPTLHGFSGIGRMLAPGLEAHIADEVCSAAFNPGTSENVDERKIAASLRKKDHRSRRGRRQVLREDAQGVRRPVDRAGRARRRRRSG
jgi:hypothetical protein